MWIHDGGKRKKGIRCPIQKERIHSEPRSRTGSFGQKRELRGKFSRKEKGQGQKREKRVLWGVISDGGEPRISHSTESGNLTEALNKEQKELMEESPEEGPELIEGAGRTNEKDFPCISRGEKEEAPG